MAMLAQDGCAPTFPTPGCIVHRYPRFFRRLQDAGAELAVHGYDHTHLGAYSEIEAAKQLVRAAQVFAAHGIQVHGFRCPYLSCSDGLLQGLPRDLFDYTSGGQWRLLSCRPIARREMFSVYKMEFGGPLHFKPESTGSGTRGEVCELLTVEAEWSREEVRMLIGSSSSAFKWPKISNDPNAHTGFEEREIPPLPASGSADRPPR